jgi:hypothetical protein
VSFECYLIDSTSVFVSIKIPILKFLRHRVGFSTHVWGLVEDQQKEFIYLIQQFKVDYNSCSQTGSIGMRNEVIYIMNTMNI